MSASVINTTGHSVTTPGGGGSQTSAYAGTSKAGSSSSSSAGYSGNLSSNNSARSFASNVSYGFSPPISSGYNNSSLTYKDIADYVFSRSVANARNVANYDYRRYKENQKHNDEMYYSARDYYTKLADTAVQRRVADLIAAGINPVLAGKFAADTPIVNPYYSSSYPTMQYVDYNSGVASAISYMNNLLDYEVGKQNAETYEKYYDVDAQKEIAYAKNWVLGIIEYLLDGNTNLSGVSKRLQDVIENNANDFKKKVPNYNSNYGYKFSAG